MCGPSCGLAKNRQLGSAAVLPPAEALTSSEDTAAFQDRLIDRTKHLRPHRQTAVSSHHPNPAPTEGTMKRSGLSILGLTTRSWLAWMATLDGAGSA